MKPLYLARLGAFALTLVVPFVSQIPVINLGSNTGTAVAQNNRKEAVKLRLEGEKQVKSQDNQGRTKVTWQALTGKVQPGDVVRYTLIAENQSDRQIKNLVLNGPVPRGTVLVLQSVQAPDNTQISYSIDGGKSFAANPTITVKLPNGKSETKPAPATAYTHIRVQVPSVSAKSTVKATYQTQVQ
ncbi:MAG: DUF11 domain-containing protein [Nostocales cyanobacterium]|nr:MAG: DUF11 domain-containing protein [Nostocales cyanobacterium]TAF15410.1 MAG: DUF11 domain-containing protein [Nostocales cyanobacterium]